MDTKTQGQTPDSLSSKTAMASLGLEEKLINGPSVSCRHRGSCGDIQSEHVYLSC